MTANYVSSKIVTAWASLGGKDGQEEGYAVKYADGYISWSPKAVFEESNMYLGHIGHYPVHVQRLMADHAEVKRMLETLPSDVITEVVTLQRDAMRLLLNVMERRIAEFAVAPCSV